MAAALQIGNSSLGGPGDTEVLYEQMQNYGRILSESKRWGKLVGGIKDDWKRITNAIILENTRKYYAGLDEVTRTLSIGTFNVGGYNS